MGNNVRNPYLETRNDDDHGPLLENHSQFYPAAAHQPYSNLAYPYAAPSQIHPTSSSLAGHPAAYTGVTANPSVQFSLTASNMPGDAHLHREIEYQQQTLSLSKALAQQEEANRVKNHLSL
jgi:hypothetical protein